MEIRRGYKVQQKQHHHHRLILQKFIFFICLSLTHIHRVHIIKYTIQNGSCTSFFFTLENQWYDARLLLHLSVKLKLFWRATKLLYCWVYKFQVCFLQFANSNNNTLFCVGKWVGIQWDIFVRFVIFAFRIAASNVNMQCRLFKESMLKWFCVTRMCIVQSKWKRRIRRRRGGRRQQKSVYNTQTHALLYALLNSLPKCKQIYTWKAGNRQSIAIRAIHIRRNTSQTAKTKTTLHTSDSTNWKKEKKKKVQKENRSKQLWPSTTKRSESIEKSNTNIGK